MNDPKFYTKRGELTAYALACGYLDSRTADGVNRFYGTDADGVMLEFNGHTYDVYVRVEGVTHHRGMPVRVEGALSGWQQFNTLTEARKHWRAKVREIVK